MMAHGVPDEGSVGATGAVEVTEAGVVVVAVPAVLVVVVGAALAAGASPVTSTTVVADEVGVTDARAIVQAPGAGTATVAA